MYKTAFTRLMGFFNELINFLSDHVFWIKQNLRIVIHPFKIKILNSNVLPVIRNLKTCSIDDMSYFIGCYKLIILCSDLIPYKKTVSDFDSTKEINHLILLLMVVRFLNLGVLRRIWIFVRPVLFWDFRVIHMVDCLTARWIDRSMIYLVDVRHLIFVIEIFIYVFDFKKLVCYLLEWGSPLYLL